MDFRYFKNTIDKLSQASLGGLEAQLTLAPEITSRYPFPIASKTNPKKAAVLALFYPDKKGDTTFLLTQRADYKGLHSKQISFPGGKYQDNDGQLRHTALRETQEEVGVKCSDIWLFKKMTRLYVPPSHFLVSPYLGVIDYRPHFVKNKEVSKLIEVPLQALMNHRHIDHTTIYKADREVKVPCFVFKEYPVWGATAMMLSEIRALIAPFNKVL